MEPRFFVVALGQLLVIRQPSRQIELVLQMRHQHRVSSTSITALRNRRTTQADESLGTRASNEWLEVTSKPWVQVHVQRHGDD